MALPSRSLRTLSRLRPALCVSSSLSSSPSSSSRSRQTAPLSTSPSQTPPRNNRSQAASRSPNPLHRHAFHSQSHPLPQAPSYGPEQTALLSAALAHVPQHGFSDAALRLGARDAGLPDVAIGGLLPRGVFELVHYHFVTRRAGLRDEVQFPEGAAAGEGPLGSGKKMGVEEKVRAVMWARLRANGEVGGRLTEAFAIMAQPINVPPSLAELARLADEILYLSGDVSVDASWYSKRAGVAAIYSAAEVFMTQDTSPGYRDTEQFLDARLEEARTVGGFLGGVGEWLGFTGQAMVNVLRSKGVRI